jgi:hypothetical protein
VVDSHSYGFVLPNLTPDFTGLKSSTPAVCNAKGAYVRGTVLTVHPRVDPDRLVPGGAIGRAPDFSFAAPLSRIREIHTTIGSPSMRQNCFALRPSTEGGPGPR